MNSWSWFDDLTVDSRAILEGLKRKSTAQSLRRILVEKYSDPDHFIYELLQNADDQQASHASIQLTDAEILFEHNGLEFREADVEYITAISLNEKADDESKIGKYGVGFKSVLNVTTRPEVFTTVRGEPFSFAIEEIIVPVPQPDPQGLARPGRTLFRLPLTDEIRETIRARVQNRLPALGPELLLFQNHLESFTWKSPVASGKYRKHWNGGDRCLLHSEWRGQEEVEEQEAEYRILRRQLNHTSTKKNLEVMLAFRLNECRIVPTAESTPLNVFFPTEVDTELHFYVHGPFLLNDSRENIQKESELNQGLMDTCAALLADSLQEFRDEGLLTTEALQALPIMMERPSSFSNEWRPVYSNDFLPFYKKCADAFATHDLVPVADGRHAKAKFVRLAESERIHELLQGEQLTQLLGSDGTIHWADKGVTERGAFGTVWRYLRSGLQVTEITSQTLANRLTKSFLEVQTDEWLAQLYESLDVMPNVWKTPTSELRCRSERPIIRLEDGSLVSPFRQENPNTPCAFLPSDQDVPSSAPIVKRAIYGHPKAAEFLRNLGLAKRSIVDDAIEEFLPSFAKDEPDLKRFVAWLEDYKFSLEVIADAVKECPPERKQALLEAILAYPFVLSFSAADASTPLLRSIKGLYEPSDELKSWFANVPNAYFISEEVLELPFWPAIKSFISSECSIPAAVLTCCKRPSASDGYVSLPQNGGKHRRGVNGFDPDAWILGLDAVLRHIDDDKARMLWNILLVNVHLVRGVIQEATWKNFGNGANYPPVLSRLGRAVTQAAWIPHVDGDLCKPDALSLGDLPGEFEKQSARAKELAKALCMEMSDLEDLAAQVEVDPAEFARFLRHKDDPRLHQMLQQLDIVQAAGFPSDEVPDPERRALRLEEEYEQAEFKEYEERVRSVRTSASAVSERKSYLRQIYSDVDGRVICQLCQLSMPFKGLDGRDYFESVMLFCKPLMEKELVQNYLALCPTCAAMFLYSRRTAEADIAKRIKSGHETVRIELADREQTLRFAPAHLLDVLSVLKVALASA